MSFDGHVDWNRMLIGLACPFEIIGKPSVAPAAAAPVAAFRNLRREPVLAALGGAGTNSLRFMDPPLKWRAVALPRRIQVICVKPRGLATCRCLQQTAQP